jgi:hypothetical protein
VPLAERALRAEPVPVAAASLRRRRPQDSPGLVSPALWLSPRQPQRGDPKTAQFQERCVATRRRAGLIGSGVWRSSGWCGIATRSTEDRNSMLGCCFVSSPSPRISAAGTVKSTTRASIDEALRIRVSRIHRTTRAANFEAIDSGLVIERMSLPRCSRVDSPLVRRARDVS